MSVQSPRTVEDDIVELIPALRAFAQRFVRSNEDAEDLVQETVCRALKSIHQFTPGTALKSWLFTILRNTFCSKYKTRKREPSGFDDVIENFAVEPQQDWNATIQDMKNALEQMESSRRRSLLLVVSGESYETVAHICGCEVGTVKSRVNRARNELRIALGGLKPV